MLSEGDVNMLNELKNLIPTEQETKLTVYIHNLINDLYYNEKIEVNSKELLELLSYLTSSDNISTQMRSAVAIQNSRIVDILHKKEVEHLKKYIEYLEENSIPKQKVKEELEKAKKENEPYEIHNKESRMFWINQGKIRLAKKLLEDK